MVSSKARSSQSGAQREVRPAASRRRDAGVPGRLRGEIPVGLDADLVPPGEGCAQTLLVHHRYKWVSFFLI